MLDNLEEAKELEIQSLKKVKNLTFQKFLFHDMTFQKSYISSDQWEKLKIELQSWESLYWRIKNAPKTIDIAKR